MDAVFGIATKSFVVLASDTFFRNNVVIAKRNQSRFTKITEKSSICCSGDQGDCMRISSLVSESISMSMRIDELPVNEKTISHVLQNEIYGRLRRNPVNVQSLVGGMETGSGSLYLVDTYGAVSEGNYISLGYASYFFYSALDQKYRPDLTEDEAIEIIKEVYSGAKSRLVISYGDLEVRIINSEGTRDVNLSDENSVSGKCSSNE